MTRPSRSIAPVIVPSMLAGLLLSAACVPPPATPADDETATAVPNPSSAPGTTLDATTALGLAALPLACLDRPHSAPRGTGYLYERDVRVRREYDRTRAFYGCYDWHSAVNSTWALVTILDRFPGLPVAPLIVERLDSHLAESAMTGELEFFETEGNRAFERPYGWAWILKLHAELLASEHPRAAAWAESTAPLAQHFAAAMPGYLERLDYPLRVGTHANTAFALDLALEYARQAGDAEFEALVLETARSLFLGDTSCPLAYEPSGSDFLSPCLEEAKLMSAVLEPDERIDWLPAFLQIEQIETLARPIQLAEAEAELDIGQMGAKSHLIGLMFTRAEALRRIAAALPEDHPMGRAAAATAADNGRNGMSAMFEAGYLGSHWLGTFAVKYLISEQLRDSR